MEPQHQRHRMERRYLKTVMLVERLGAVVQRVYQQRPNTGVLRYGHSPMNRVLQQRSAQLDALGAMVDGTGSGMLRRTAVVAAGCDTAPAAIA
jgi:hypothetical protein